MTDRGTWNKCWAQAGSSIPGYFSQGEYEKLNLLRLGLFHRYFEGIDEVSEFGCGLGHNLAVLKSSGKTLHGYDWSPAAVKRVRAMGIDAKVFDMLKPDMNVKPKGGVFTVHAMEQLGSRWWEFLLYLFHIKPKVIIHIEPIAELYDDSPRDRKRLAYHMKRGYLTGYLTHLYTRVFTEQAQILEMRKSEFGGKYHDAYSVIVWRPL